MVQSFNVDKMEVNTMVLTEVKLFLIILQGRDGGVGEGRGGGRQKWESGSSPKSLVQHAHSEEEGREARKRDGWRERKRPAFRSVCDEARESEVSRCSSSRGKRCQGRRRFPRMSRRQNNRPLSGDIRVAILNIYRHRKRQMDRGGRGRIEERREKRS